MKVLVVEDDDRLRELIAKGIRREGHAVDAVSSVEDAHWLATQSTHDVLVLDVMLPDGDGFELCRRLRAAGVWTPVLMLTARGAVEDRVRGLDVGADDYLVKPFAFAELLARMRALVRRGAQERPTTIQIGDLEIDPAARRATVRGQPLALTAREFALLEYFGRHANEAIPRSRIIEEVWDWAFDGSSRVIDVYVRVLRLRLGTGPRVPRLETIRGVGYAFRPPLVEPDQQRPRPGLRRVVG